MLSPAAHASPSGHPYTNPSGLPANMASQPGPSSGNFIQAVDYNDTWFLEKETEFNVYYICQRKYDAEGKDRCNAAIQSLAWDRMIADPIANKQRWYCNVCGARYKTAYGVLVELIVKGNTKEALYCKADLPPEDMKDLKAMCVQSKLRHANTPQELLAALPTLSPQDRGTFFTETKPGVFTFTTEVCDSLPKMEWYQLYNLVKEDKELPGTASSSFP